MNRRIIYFIFFLLLQIPVFAQQLPVDSLLSISQNGSDREKLDAFHQLAQIYKNNDPVRASGFSEKAILLATQLNDETALAKNTQAYASIQYRLGNFIAAKEYYQQAFSHYTHVQDEKGQIECLNALAGIHFAQGNLPLAVENYLIVLRYYESRNDKAGMASVYNSLTTIYTRQNNFSKAIEYNLKAIAIYESSSDKLRALVGYDNIGNSYLKQNNLPKAAEFFNRSLKTYTEINNRAGMASSLYQLGTIAAKQKNFTKAESYYKRSLAISMELQTQPLTVGNLNALGDLYKEERLYGKAIKSYQDAIAIAKPTSMKIELEEAYKGLSDIYQLTKEGGKASTFSSLSNQLKDSLFNDSILKRMSDVTLRYEGEKKQREIESLSKEQQIREAELHSQRELNRFILISAIALSIVLVILIFFYIQNKRFSNSLQQQQKELIRKTEEITEQKEKVDQLNNVKDRFFSIISHDLRNNLTTMKLYFDLISNPDYQPEDNTEITKQISSSVENTIDLLENLLVWASAQIKGIPIHLQKLNVHSLTEENIHLLNGNASQKKISIQNLVGEEVNVYADMDMINLVLRNLISNAIKFTNNNGRITVQAKASGNENIISVSDNGIGISKENLAKLFDQHQHSSTKGTANEKGTGLGLLLCKDFVERNHGHIWAESEKEKGTTFYFTLPVSYAES